MNEKPNAEQERIKRFLQQNNALKAAKDPIIPPPLSENEKKEFIRQKLFAETPKEQDSFFSWKRFRAPSKSIYQGVDNYFMNFTGRNFKVFMYETLPFLLFIGFSSYVLYRMEKEYDKMVRSVIKVKTIKQEQVQKEDDYIRSALARDKYRNSNQIQDVPDRTTNYKFEEMDEEELHTKEFSTQDDFYEYLRRDHNKGISIPEEYKQQVTLYSQRQNKPLVFNQPKIDQEEEEGEGEEEEEGQEEQRRDVVILNPQGQKPRQRQ